MTMEVEDTGTRMKFKIGNIIVMKNKQISLCACLFTEIRIVLKNLPVTRANMQPATLIYRMVLSLTYEPHMYSLELTV